MSPPGGGRRDRASPLSGGATSASAGPELAPGHAVTRQLGDAADPAVAHLEDDQRRHVEAPAAPLRGRPEVRVDERASRALEGDQPLAERVVRLPAKEAVQVEDLLRADPLAVEPAVGRQPP